MLAFPDEVGLSGQVLGAFIILVSGTLTVRCLRTGVTLEPDQWIVRRALGTQKIPVDTIRQVRIVTSGAIIPWRYLAIVTSRRTVRIGEIATLPDGDVNNSRAGRIANELGAHAGVTVLLE